MKVTVVLKWLMRGRDMKKIVYLFVAITVLAILSACNKEVDPEQRLSQYIEYWNKEEFAKMYGMLSKEAKESVSEEDFVSRYEKVYTDLGIANLDISHKKSEKEQDTDQQSLQLPFSAKMDSLAGEIAFEHQATLVKEERDDEENWYIEWDTTYIFPELGPNDEITYNTVKAKRGEIVDRSGDPLAFNGTILEIGIVPEQMDSEDETVKQVAKLLEISENSVKDKLGASWVQANQFVPIKKIATNQEELLNNLMSIPGVLKKDIEGRVYPGGEAASHLIGNVAQVTADDLEEHEGKGYGSNDVIGRRGLEKVYEEKLRGSNGVLIGIKKEDGSEVVVAETPVENGSNVQLTIDLTLQEDLYKELDHKPGTAAAIDPVTGETLALVSSPGFDPNQATLGYSASQLEELEESGDNPFLNRFQHTYAPGSVIKPITGALALKEGAIKPEDTIEVKGLQWPDDNRWGDYRITRVSDPGKPVNFDLAMMYSDNIYFARAALELGKDKLTAGLKEFGFTEDIPFAYPLESSTIGELDKETLIADSGYGQGHVEMSILHLATSYTPFINNGSMIKPILLLNDEEKSQVWKENIIDETTVKTVAESMNKVVNEPGGTARTARIEGYPLAGKTGTAELKQTADEEGKENGWFVAYNPDDPHLLISMMVEGVEEQGGSKIVIEKVKDTFEKNKDRF